MKLTYKKYKGWSQESQGRVKSGRLWNFKFQWSNLKRQSKSQKGRLRVQIPRRRYDIWLSEEWNTLKSVWRSINSSPARSEREQSRELKSRCVSDDVQSPNPRSGRIPSETESRGEAAAVSASRRIRGSRQPAWRPYWNLNQAANSLFVAQVGNLLKGKIHTLHIIKANVKVTKS